MTLTPEQEKALLEAAKPLMKWLNENAHPHCTVQVDQVSVELVEGICAQTTHEFLKE